MEQAFDKQASYKDFGLKQYMDQSKYEHKSASSASVQKLKDAMKKDISSLRKEIRSALGNKAQFPDTGKGIKELANDVLSESTRAAVMKELADIKNIIIPKDVESSQAGVKYQDKLALENRVYAAENALFMEKTGFKPSSENLKLLGEKLKLYNGTKWIDGMNDTKMRELVLLDDFPSLLKTGISALSAVIPSLAPFAPAAGQIIDAITGVKADQGLNMENSYQDRAKYISKQQPVINQISDTMSVASRPSRFEPDAVDLSSIATILCPEMYKNVCRYDDALPSSTSTYFVEIPVIPTTANGTFFFFINPAISILGGAFSFISYTNAASTYSPASGTFTGNIGLGNPTISLSSTIQASRVAGLTVTYVPNTNTSTNLTNGQIEMWQDPAFQGQPTDFASPTGYLTQLNIGYKPFYTKGPVTQEQCAVYYNTLDDTPFTDTTGTSDVVEGPIVLILTGASTSGQQIGTIMVNIVFNNTPTSAGLATQPVRNPGLGPFTADFINSCLTDTPQLFMSTLPVRSELITRLANTDCRYRSMMEATAALCVKKNYHLPSAAPVA
jgi:hypothetical protein